MLKQEYTNKAGEKRFKPVISEKQYWKMDNESKGFCLGCGATRGECEPDARKYQCLKCKKALVYGMGELAVMNLLVIK